jgi:DNA-directed RNA polymerase II subunit RPB1
MINKQLEINNISSKLMDSFGDMITIMHSDVNADKLVMRIRFKDLKQDEDNESVVGFLKEIEDTLLNELSLKGFPEIAKVYAKKYQEPEYDHMSKGYKMADDNWMLETDGVALSKILPVTYVDYKKTISNDIIEILNVLGIEAVRMALINELRAVLNFYGIYVNYRHIATLCDVMTHKGKLTSITRHGINRLDCGPLRKCSFEETVEILLEAAVYNENDMLKGITENIILGQLAPFGTGSFDLVLDS